jgi:hypothetical protein
MKSEEELRIKWSRPRPDTGEPYDDDKYPPLVHLDAAHDEEILIYVPDLKKALREREEALAQR